MPMRRSALLHLVLFGALISCLPVETVEIPGDVEWIASVVDSSQDSVRLLHAPSTPPLLINDRDTEWLLGFSAEAFQGLDWSPTVTKHTRLRVAAPCEKTKLVPIWALAVRGSGEAPRLTNAEVKPRSCEPIDRDSFTVQAFEVPDQFGRLSSRLGYGMSSSNIPLLVVDESLFELRANGPNFIGSLGVWPVRSILKLDDSYMAIAGHDLYTGFSPRRLTNVDADRGAYGVLFWSRRFGPLYISSNGESVLRLRDIGEHPGDWTRARSEISVAEDDDGYIIAAGRDKDENWSWRWDGESLERNMGLHRPLASTNGLSVFGDVAGAIRTPHPVDSNSTRVIANVPSTRLSPFVPSIIDIAAYQGGFVAGDYLGYLTWIEASGKTVELAHIVHQPRKIFVSGDQIFVIAKDINEQPSHDRSSTNVLVYVLSRKP